MTTQIVHISKLQTAKVMALLYLILSIPLTLVSFLPMLFTNQPIPFGMLLLMPVLYVVIGFVFTFVGAWVYNGVASKFGGIEFTLAERSVD